MRAASTLAFPCVAALALSLVSLPAVARAQVTLVVRDGGETSRALDAAIDEALRAYVGAMVRHVDPTLDDLALAAGCASTPTSPVCVRTVAQAAEARWVAIETLDRDGAEWRVRLDLRRTDGTRVRELSLRCDDASTCSTELAIALGAETRSEVEPATTSASYVPRPAPPSATARADAMADVPSRHGETPSATPAPHLDDAPQPVPTPTAVASIPLVPTALFAGAALAGIGALVAGGVSVQAGNDAAGLGVLRSEAQVDHERALEEQHDVALGVGIALASVGAGLAIAGAFTFARDDGPRLRLGLLDASLTVDF